MRKAILKDPIEVEFITFDELVEYGKNNGGNIVNDMPWSFHYMEHPITHENDECYLIPLYEDEQHLIQRFTPNDYLITGLNKKLYVCEIGLFKKIYNIID